MAEQSKNQYFTGKPKKADRPKNYQNKSKKNQQPQSGGSYFKQKNKKDKTKY